MNHDLTPEEASRLDAALTAATTGPDDDAILARARVRVGADVARRRSGSRPWVIALTAAIPAAAAAVLAFALLGNLGHPVSKQTVGAPTPSPSGEPQASPSPSVPPAPTASPAVDRLTALQMFDATHGWATDQADAASNTERVLRTTDGGSTWTVAGPAGHDVVLDTFFLDAGKAWVVTEPASARGQLGPQAATVHSTHDGGATWRSAPISVDGSPGSGMSFVDSIHGWLTTYRGSAAGSNGIYLYRTEDGGATWSPVADGDPGSTATGPGHMPGGCQKNAPTFATSLDGYLTEHCAGGDTFLYASHDGGRTWTAQHLPLPDLSSGWVSNCDCGTNRPVFNGADGWMNLDGMVEGGPIHNLYVTHDSGRTWKGHRLPGQPQSGSMPAFSMLAGGSDAYGMITPSDDGTSHSAKLFHTLDGGQTWTPTKGEPGVDGVPDFISDSIGWLVLNPSAGASSALYQTTDGATSWQQVQYRIVGTRS